MNELKDQVPRMDLSPMLSQLYGATDTPDPEIAVLERLFDRVLAGGVVVLDDYGRKMSHGQREAEDDFMRRRGYEILELLTGRGLVVKR